MNTYAYVGGNPLSFIDVYGLCFFGKSLAQEYIENFGDGAWRQSRRDRDENETIVVPGTASEALRNAEHYLYAREQVRSNSYNWGSFIVFAVAFNTVKFWANVGEYYGVNDSRWTDSINTSDELKAGIEGANDGVFGDDPCECTQ